MISATAAWLDDLETVFNSSDFVSRPRGQETRESLGFASQPVDMSLPVITTPERKLGYKFLAAEAAWILSGDDRVSTIAPFSKEISRFSDDGVVFAGAYGPKIVAQLDYVVDCLVKDPDSRQAVINIWRENPAPSKDIPCTLSAQFILREGLLYCVDTMRSSDLWLGHVYDVFNFSMLSAWVAIKLRGRTGRSVGLGSLTLTAGSKHIYERDFEKVQAVLSARHMGQVDDGPEVKLDKFKVVDDLVSHLWLLAWNGKALEQSSWDV